MNTTELNTLPPPIRAFVESIAKGLQLEASAFRIDPMPVRESTAPFKQDAAAAEATLKDISHRLLKAKFQSLRSIYTEACLLFLAHGFKPGEDFIGCLKKVLDHWNGRPFLTPEEEAAALGKDRLDEPEHCPAAYPSPEIPADRHHRAGFPIFYCTDTQAADFLSARLRPSLNGTPRPALDEIDKAAGGFTPQAIPRKRRPVSYTVPALCWRYGSTPGELRGYLEPEPQITLFLITPDEKGEGGYRLDGLTLEDGKETPRFNSIMTAQDDAQAQLNGWALRHFLTRQNLEAASGN